MYEEQVYVFHLELLEVLRLLCKGFFVALSAYFTDNVDGIVAIGGCGYGLIVVQSKKVL